VHSEPLLSRIPCSGGSRYEGKNQEHSNKVIKSVFAFFLGASIGIVGIWHICFSARSRSLYLITGTVLVIIGFLICVHADLIADFGSKIASVSSEIGVSATCYRRAEDIRIVPIVIAELELGKEELRNCQLT
jgi:uncharacterized membrane protein YiaA